MRMHAQNNTVAIPLGGMRIGNFVWIVAVGRLMAVVEGVPRSHRRPPQSGWWQSTASYGRNVTNEPGSHHWLPVQPHVASAHR